MAIGKALENGPPRDGEFAPGSDPDNAFYAGALFAYRDAAKLMGDCLISQRQFDAWLDQGEFSPAAIDCMRRVYREAYNGK